MFILCPISGSHGPGGGGGGTGFPRPQDGARFEDVISVYCLKMAGFVQYVPRVCNFMESIAVFTQGPVCAAFLTFAARLVL